MLNPKLIFISLLFIGLSSFGQHAPGFNLKFDMYDHNLSEMGSYPIIEIKNHKLIYRVLRNDKTYQIDKWKSGRADTVWDKKEVKFVTKIRESSLDSIYSLAKSVKYSSSDSTKKKYTVYSNNPDVLIISGVEYYITLSSKDLEIDFSMHSSCTKIAKGIINILNTYLPKEDRIVCRKGEF